MAKLDDLICQSINPFDVESLASGNFWQEQQNRALTVNSIHQEAVEKIEELLDTVIQNRYSQTVLLAGDSGSGKSYLLGRLKRTFNSKAFFAYIDPWADSDFIWRHILRQMVDSLLYKPEGEEEPQLLLWLKGLSAFREGGFAKWMMGERNLFIRNLETTFPAGTYNSKQFFGVLYDLTNSELYSLACQWLRGDDLDDDDLRKLKVKRAIDSENAAKGILGNFSRIATNNRPIVFCFDSLDSIPRLPQGNIDLQALFNVNTIFYNQYFKNFLVIISIIKSTWDENKRFIQPADLAPGRLHREVYLKPINKKQIEALWVMRLHSLHQQSKPKPISDIEPLSKEQINLRFPRGKTLPRMALSIGRELFQQYKDGLRRDTKPPIDRKAILLAEFELKWQDEFAKTKERIKKITFLSAPDLIRILQDALKALQVKELRTKFIRGKYSGYSLNYKNPHKQEKVGVVWTEDANFTSFFSVMNACQKALRQKQCQTLYLIRVGSVGTAKLKGNQIYRKIFTGSPHRHIRETLTSVHYLATYQELVKSARANELVLAGKTISVDELESLIRQTEILKKCKLLKDLGIFDSVVEDVKEREEIVEVADEKAQEIKTFLLNRLKTQNCMALAALQENAIARFGDLNKTTIKQQVKMLIEEDSAMIYNPTKPLEEQLIAWVPQGTTDSSGRFPPF
ncbi:ATP-binding protein [Lusitaniella coriacea LEGE 07157]|uniref:ATP-binding protein n=1 Tax=Lusitaniella coriacea LEGE 07157 TaxID=945747 RepID=A0A8J7IWR1_9CYAN|nr:ATP-binding protein [Lusitaniella coriacea]MBE9118228.1 ATP-binding protein [Lusitaniella coriacea LEGE 07157]